MKNTQPDRPPGLALVGRRTQFKEYSVVPKLKLELVQDRVWMRTFREVIPLYSPGNLD